jgi:hypothetical protein
MKENKQAPRDPIFDYPTSSIKRDSYVEPSRESSIPAALTLCMEYARVSRWQNSIKLLSLLCSHQVLGHERPEL